MLDKIERFIKIGSKDKFWYERCQALFEELYGKDRLKLVTNIFAATSINSSLKSNIYLFRKALHEIETGKEFSNYLPVMKLQLERIRSGEPIRGRKISSFAKAMSGDRDAVVVDVWLLRAFDQDKKFLRQLSGRLQSGGATDRQYDMIELFCREYANKHGLDARQVSAMIWAGVRIDTNGDRETHYETLLRQQEYSMFN